jgi:hypothetical protein
MNDESRRVSQFIVHHSAFIILRWFHPSAREGISAGFGWAGLAAIPMDRPASLATSLRVLISVVAFGRDMRLWGDYAARRLVCQTALPGNITGLLFSYPTVSVSAL